MIDFSKMPCIYWDDVTKINYIQRRVIIHSLIYYVFNESVISDNEYDSISKQLVQMSQELPEDILSKSKYYYCMNDFDGSTGFDIPSRLTKEDYEYLTIIASHILNQWRKANGKN